ncbi:MAG: glycosyl hydrolase family 17 protein [Phycisphaeraceae bacterium]
MPRSLTIILAFLTFLSPAIAQPPAEPGHPRQSPFIKRPFDPTVNGQWAGEAICYGPHRDGQSPDGLQPTPDQVLEDLHIITRHWNMLRMYGARGATETSLQLIREHDLPLKVVVGAWIATETSLDEGGNPLETFPETIANNQAEVQTAIRLANQYPDIVAAVTIGNETQVDWSFHPVQLPVLINYIRHARAHTSAPVSTADVSTYWATPESKPLADELDFIMTHIYAMWNKQSLDTALDWTRDQYNQGTTTHPDHQFVIGEAGWATTSRKAGEEGELITGVASEANQTTFYREFVDWTTAEKIPNFFFQAFDEKWKGDEHADGAEKHWGLYFSNRTPKQALRQPQP